MKNVARIQNFINKKGMKIQFKTIYTKPYCPYNHHHQIERKFIDILR